MTNRRTFLTVVATALLALCLPVLASAQGSYGRGRDDGYYGRNDRSNIRSHGREDRYSNRFLRDAARRVSDRSRDFQRHLDDALDHSRYDASRREDRINDVAREFRNVANDFKNQIGDGRNLNRGSDEAQRLLQLGTRIDRFISRNRLDSRSASDWSQIRQDLRLIADVYGYRINGNDDGYIRRGNAPWQRLP
jgi:hypothetical protein